MKIKNWNKLNKAEQETLLQRAATANTAAMQTKTCEIIDAVKRDGDKALFAFSEKFDQAQLSSLAVRDTEFEQAQQSVSEKKLNTLKTAINRIENYQRQLLPQGKTIDSLDGIVCRRIARAIDRAGLYVPGGSAPLVSTMMMLLIPAKLAGCPVCIACSPPSKNGKINPLLLVTAKLCGIKQFYKVGGAQAIAAMAYGTETIPKVDKLFGPGNNWVTMAKQIVAQDPNGAAIDMPAGPSEVMVIADQSADPAFVAADLLSQMEHGASSQALLVTIDQDLANAVTAVLNKQLQTLSRQKIIEQSMQHSSIIIAEDMQEAMTISNQYAPEHLILHVVEPEQYIEKINNAGAVFIGPWTPEAMGDYINGSNHVLPTYGYAKSYSGLSVNDFMKFISIQTVNESGMKSLGPTACDLTDMEGLDAHKNAIKLRLDNLS